MRRGAEGLVLLIAVALSLLPAAEAKRTDGGTVRVLREKRTPGWQLFLAFSEGEERVQLYGDSRPIVGGTLAVLDTRGWQGEVRIDESTAEPSGCQGLFQARATHTHPQHSRDAEGIDGVAVAIGPADRSLHKARLYYKDKARGDLPYSNKETLLGAIDVDGDESLDVAVYFYDCQRGPSSPLTPRPNLTDLCVESFSREGASWRAIRRTRVEHCFD